MADVKERVDKQLRVLDDTVALIEGERKRYEAEALSQGRYHRVFTAVLAVFAVLAPAIVTLQSQQRDTPWLAVLAIGLTATAGAGTALQGAFRWGERYRRTRLTALELSELYSSVRMDRLDVEDTEDPIKVYSKISELNQRAAARHQAIVRNHIEAEVALTTPPADKSRGPVGDRAAGR